MIPFYFSHMYVPMHILYFYFVYMVCTYLLVFLQDLSAFRNYGSVMAKWIAKINQMKMMFIVVFIRIFTKLDINAKRMSIFVNQVSWKYLLRFITYLYLVYLLSNRVCSFRPWVYPDCLALWSYRGLPWQIRREWLQ